MANYGKRSFKRYYRRYPRVLRTSSIFGRTSAKSQARQIAALRRRISRVSRNCAPEIKTYTGQAETVNYSSQTLSSYYKIYPLIVPSEGTGPDDRLGNQINVKKLHLYLTGEYYNTSETGYHTSESSGCQVRVVIGQFKTTQGANTIPSIDEIFAYSSGSGSNYTQMSVVPLKDGITTKYRILADKRFTLTTDRNQAMKTYSIKPVNYKWFAGNNYNNCWVCILVAGLHSDANFTENCKITFSNKIVYTDA